jgi:cytochrome c oxidase subunit 2
MNFDYFLINKKNFNINFDSILMEEKLLKSGTHRILEVDNRLILPIGVPIKFLITSVDVLHS